MIAKIIYCTGACKTAHGDAWLSLVERCVRDAEAAGSNPVASTTWQGCRKPSDFKGFRFFFISGIFLPGYKNH